MQSDAWHQSWRSSAWGRLLLVSLFSLVISFVLWGIGTTGSLDVQMVYSFGTGISIWFLTDIVRHQLFPPKDIAWLRSWDVWLFFAVSIAVGFVAGILLGDWYAGWSTLDLLSFAPLKLAGLVVMCVAISVAFITFFYQQNRLQVAQRQATETKLQLLQSQLEPHMLFNTLANLRVLIALDSTRAQAMLDRLIDYLRTTLGASRVTSHALRLEFDRVDDYLALMQIRLGTRLSYTLDLPDALKTTLCPALILQPVVENAVLHGLEPSAAGGEIRVAAKQVDQNIILTVTDTGLGFENKSKHISAESNSGFGLAQLRERLYALHGHEAGVVISAHNSAHSSAHISSGTCVTITLPATA